jgi:hypothetical protein
MLRPLRERKKLYLTTTINIYELKSKNKVMVIVIKPTVTVVNKKKKLRNHLFLRTHYQIVSVSY